MILVDTSAWIAFLWQEAGDLGYALRRKGVAVKSFDLLIATYALSHGTELSSLDAGFSSMRGSGVPLQLVNHDE